MSIHTKQANFDRFDICEAWYCYAETHCKGQGSKEYKVLGRLINLGFKPSPLLSIKTLSENSRWIYACLVRQKGKHINP